MAEDDPTISVVIPLYNGARFITQALDSVFAQTIAPAEVIVVDDGSTDDGRLIVSNYTAARLIIVLSKPNGGQSSARNFGISHSKGKLIALLDQDDVWYPTHLQALARPFSADADGRIGWTYSNLDEISEHNKMIARSALSTSGITHPKTQLRQCLREDMFVLPSASMISRRAFDAVGGFDEQLCGYEDDDLFVRLFVAGYRNVYIKQALSQWRVYTASTSYSPRMAKSRMIYALKLLRAFPDETILQRFYSSDLIAPRFLRQTVGAARQALRFGDQAAIDACLEHMSILEQHIAPRRRRYAIRQDLLITAIMPLFNGAPFIREALQSILEQTLPPDEIIVVDDGSTDAGPDILAELAQLHPIRLIRKANGGQSSARNTGVDHAHGDLIAFLDQDDVWYPNHLAELVKPFLEPQSRDIGWSYSDLDEINEAGEMVTRAILASFKGAHPKRDLASCLRQDMFVLPSASLISRRAFHSVGGFDERLSGYEDDDLFLRLFLGGFDSVYLSETLSRWRIYQTSSSYTPRMAASRAVYARMLIERFPDDVERFRYYVRDLIAPRFFRAMASELRKAVLKGTRSQQTVAFANLTFITGHLRAYQRLPLRLFVLPALRIPPLARFIMRHRILLVAVCRRLF